MMARIHSPVGMRSWRDFQTRWHPSGDVGEPVPGREPLSHLYAMDEPEVELIEQDDAYWLMAELGDMPQDDITVWVDANTVMLRGEWPEAERAQTDEPDARPYRAFARQFVLAKPVEPDTLSVTYVDGALAVCIRKLTQTPAEPSLARTA